MRVLNISASLLPEDIVAARQARRTRGLVVVAVAVVAGLCAAWFAVAYHQKQEADQARIKASAAVTALQSDQREFTETLQVQADTKLLNEQLAAVMANDLDWAALLAALRSAGAPSGITVSGVNGQLTASDDAAATVKVLPGSATDTVGSLLVSGAGPDKKAVAAYVEALGRRSVVTNPYVTSVASDDSGGVTFSLRVDITRAALCGRFTTACTNSGGN
jgi:hypothetical protein